MENKYLALILVAVIAIIAIGGYYGFKEYQSLNYNQNLNKSDEMWTGALKSLNETDLDTKSYDTNINLIKDAMNKTDLAINYTQIMINDAPDNATKEYAIIRLSQYNESKKIMNIYLKLNEDLKSNGILSVLSSMNTFEQEINKINSNLEKEQNQLIKLVNSNPELKNRLVTVLGEQRVNEILTPPGNDSDTSILQ